MEAGAVLMCRGRVAVVLIALITGSCAGGHRIPARPTIPRPSAPASTSSPPVDQLQGTWSTGLHSCREWHAGGLRAGASENQWVNVMQGRRRCPRPTARGGAWGHIFQFQQGLLTITDRIRGQGDETGFNGVYRLEPGRRIVASDSDDRVTARYRIHGRELRLRILSVNGVRPFHESMKRTAQDPWPGPYFELTWDPFRFFRQG